MSLKETAEIMCSEIGVASWNLVPFPEDRKAIDVGDFICDYCSFSSAFGWEPKIKFEEGIKRSLEYFQSELEHYI
jgi:nucleoside-diphosphate-sugar epimerase